MKINLDSNTSRILKQKMAEYSKDTVRLMIRSYGWGGPILGLVLDEQRETDAVEIVDGIRFVVDNEETFLFDDVSVIYEKGLFRDSFRVVRNGSYASSC